MTKIVGLYLAAGSSLRMGRNKLSLPLGNTTVGSRTLQAACLAQLDEVLVLTKEHDPLDWIQTPAFGSVLYQKCRQIECPCASGGQSYTLRCGVEAAEKAEATAVVVMLADQPLVPTNMLNALIRTFRRREMTDREIVCVAASYQGIARPPVLFSYQLFSTLKQLNGDEGARSLLRGGSLAPMVAIEYATQAFFQDVDTVTDYEAIRIIAGG